MSVVGGLPEVLHVCAKEHLTQLHKVTVSCVGGRVVGVWGGRVGGMWGACRGNVGRSVGQSVGECTQARFVGVKGECVG